MSDPYDREPTLQETSGIYKLTYELFVIYIYYCQRRLKAPPWQILYTKALMKQCIHTSLRTSCECIYHCCGNTEAPLHGKSIMLKLQGSSIYPCLQNSCEHIYICRDIKRGIYIIQGFKEAVYTLVHRTVYKSEQNAYILLGDVASQRLYSHSCLSNNC